MMFCEHGKILFARFFNPYTTGGIQKTGFFGNFDFSELYTDLDILSEIVPDLIDAYLYNEYSTRYVSSSWSRFMIWDKTNKRYNINPDFYGEFAKAFCGHLMTAQNFFDLTKIDFASLGDYIRKTKLYADKVKTTERGDDKTTVGEREDNYTIDTGSQNTRVTDNTGAQNIRETETLGEEKTRNINSYGKVQNDVETTNQRSGFNDSNFVNDTHTKTDNDTEAHTDNLSFISEETENNRVTSSGAREDTHVTTTGQRQDKQKIETGEQETTKEYGNITEREYGRTDVETIDGSKGYDREKLLNIKKELASMNVYQIIGDAIVATMLTNEWGW